MNEFDLLVVRDKIHSPTYISFLVSLSPTQFLAVVNDINDT